MKYLIFNLDFSISFYLLRVSPRVAIAALKFLCEHTCINFVNYVNGSSWNIVVRKKKELGLRVEGNVSPLPRIMCAVFAFCHRYNVDGQNITYGKLLPFCLSTRRFTFSLEIGWKFPILASWFYGINWIFFFLFVYLFVVFFLSLMAYLNLNWTWKKCPKISYNSFVPAFFSNSRMNLLTYETPFYRFVGFSTSIHQRKEWF